MQLQQLRLYLIVGILAVGLVACSDNSSGPEHGQQPGIPDLKANAQPDISFFQNNQPGSRATTESNVQENYSSARAAVLVGAAITVIGQTYFGFINPASGKTADFKGGQWVWEYSASQNGASYSIRTTANPRGEGYDWATFVSYNDGQGTKVDNAKVMEGSTQNGGARGDWTFFIPDGSSQKAFTSKWTVTSDNKKAINAAIFGENGSSIEVNIEYSKDGASNTMSFIYPDQDSRSVEVFWNSETKVGYIDDGDEQLCWNASLQNAPCSEVGL